jgi:protein-disulfide isomerase
MDENTPLPNLENVSAPEEPARKNRRKLPTYLFAILFPLVFALGLAVGYLVWGKDAKEMVAQRAAAQEAQKQAVQNIKRYDVPVDDDPSFGPADAPLTLIEFSDFECPYCQRWQEEVWGQLQKSYGDKIRLVYRDFPLPGHPNAIPAAEAANCANEQGKFWEYHDLLFGGSQGLSEAAYVQYAQSLGLDMTSFNQCVSEHRYNQEIQADYQWASELGVNSTPTFFLNGIPLVGAQPIDVFTQVIELELKGEIPK